MEGGQALWGQGGQAGVLASNPVSLPRDCVHREFTWPVQGHTAPRPGPPTGLFASPFAPMLKALAFYVNCLRAFFGGR